MANPAKVFSVGVVGYGMSAKVFHIPFIQITPTLKLHSILQRTPKPDDSAPSDHPNIQHFTTYESFLADPSLDLVVLTTTPPTHFALASQALEAGKHILVEKPFVPSSAEASKLVSLARSKRLLICVYQNRRYDADYATVQEFVRDGTLGRIVEFETHFDRYRAEKPTNWKGTVSASDGGGPLYDLGTHLIDQVYALFGTPRSVFAKLVNQRDGTIGGPEDEADSVNAQLFYADGMVVYVRIGVLSVEARQPRFWVRGTKGSFRKECLDPQEPQLKDYNAGLAGGLGPADAQFGIEPEDWAGKLTVFGGADGKTVEEKTHPTAKPPTYREFYRRLATALGSGKEEDLPVSAAEAGEVLKIIEAVRESNRNGKEVLLT